MADTSASFSLWALLHAHSGAHQRVGRVVAAAAVGLATIGLLGGCQKAQPETDRKDVPKTEVWRPIDSWSGQANAQLGTFWIESFDWRVRWEATETAPDSYLRVVVHSGDSGRDLAIPVDTKGSGRGTGYVTELPRAFYLTVETRNTAWKLWVDESIGVKLVDPSAATAGSEQGKT